MLESEQYGEEGDDFLFEQGPELDLFRCALAVIFLVEHGDIGHEINKLFFSLISLSELLNRHPFPFLRLLFGTNSELCLILT